MVKSDEEQKLLKEPREEKWIIQKQTTWNKLKTFLDLQGNNSEEWKTELILAQAGGHGNKNGGTWLPCYDVKKQ